VGDRLLVDRRKELLKLRFDQRGVKRRQPGGGDDSKIVVVIIQRRKQTLDGLFGGGSELGQHPRRVALFGFAGRLVDDRGKLSRHRGVDIVAHLSKGLLADSVAVLEIGFGEGGDQPLSGLLAYHIVITIVQFVDDQIDRLVGFEPADLAERAGFELGIRPAGGCV